MLLGFLFAVVQYELRTKHSKGQRNTKSTPKKTKATQIINNNNILKFHN